MEEERLIWKETNYAGDKITVHTWHTKYGIWIKKNDTLICAMNKTELKRIIKELK